MKQIPPLLRIGFRPFFFLAGVFSVLAILAWMGIYAFSWSLTPSLIPITTWHAHEMIYGYTMAVVAGFLLTAVRNWTKLDTLTGLPLLGLVVLWISARVFAFIPLIPIQWIEVLDVSFLLGLTVGIGIPIIRSKNWRNLGILAKVLFFAGFNFVFYLGALGYVPDGVRIGLYGGLYLIIALIVTIGRRVIPFFTERGLNNAVLLRNRKWLDISSLILFVVFYIIVLTSPQNQLVGFLSLILAALYALRLYDWYTPLIWKKPLIWVLHVAYFSIVVGFVLTACAIFWGSSPYLAVHAFAYGSIGLSTIGMMSRVSLGHTGRDIHSPPKAIPISFILIGLGTVVRCIFPLIMPKYYVGLIIISQIMWVVAFGVFTATYLPIWIGPRIDEKWA